MKIAFKEQQKFTQWWLWLLLIAIGILAVFGFYRQIILGRPFGNVPMSDSLLILFTALALLLILMFASMRLTTVIDQSGIRMRFFPFAGKRAAWSEIKKAEVINYGFVGGWGIRIGTEYGTVYNTKGNRGLAIELMNGKKFLIGTQKEAEMAEAVEKLRESNPDGHR